MCAYLYERKFKELKTLNYLKKQEKNYFVSIIKVQSDKILETKNVWYYDIFYSFLVDQHICYDILFFNYINLKICSWKN